VVIELPTIEAKLEIGTINPRTGEVSVTANYVQYSCSFSTDCCGSDDFLVPVTEVDIERIENHGFELDQIVENLSPEIRFAQDNTAEKNYWIKRKPFTGKCTFLDGNKCSIHTFKPFACRIFPFQLMGNDDESYRVVVHQSNLCQSIRPATKQQAENRELLQSILKEVQAEDQRRLTYFAEYGSD